MLLTSEQINESCDFYTCPGRCEPYEYPFGGGLSMPDFKRDESMAEKHFERVGITKWKYLGITLHKGENKHWWVFGGWR